MLTSCRLSRCFTFPKSHMRKFGLVRGSRLFSSVVDKPDFPSQKDSKYFDFNKMETSIYAWWEKSGYFNAGSIRKENSESKKFVVTMPPPNVTGYLHMGHALFLALQDLMVRYNRMKGLDTLWLPGTDHAGIATQHLVEKAVLKEGLSRQELGRDAFLDRVWKWKNEKGEYIIRQMKRMGASADWSMSKFTMDSDVNEAVNEAFVTLHDRGLIYRGEYMVNWSPNLQTAISDLEVEYSEEKGTLYYFKYMVEGSSEFLPVATTRPETIIGDTAVCVHPCDERYKHLIGKMVRVPLMNRLVPVIADEYVDMEFGTGALKITPAHDINDYALGKKHQLPSISVMDKKACINEVGGSKYQGLDRYACRKLFWDDLEKADLTIRTEEISQRVPRSQRGGEVIEPMVSKQWFLKMDVMANRAIKAVQSKSIKIIPDRYEKTWYQWLENIHDWCVSRQLWWGHQIPVFYLANDPEKFVVARNREEATAKARLQYGDISSTDLVQEEDVLDTWFSSGLWPFVTVGWPNEGNPSYQSYYPTAVMETGHDILFFWVARMVMLGEELTGKLPFHTIYLHGLVRDEQGQKMSKTKGNVIDPLDSVDKYGCDALRFALVANSLAGQDLPLSTERIETARNFVNKLWNLGKFVEFSLSNATQDGARVIDKEFSWNEVPHFPLCDRFIISRCHGMVREVSQFLDDMDYASAARVVHDFLWDDFADWYVEASKTRRNDQMAVDRTQQILSYVWNTSLKCLHPFMPYVTETLWQLNNKGNEDHLAKNVSLMVSSWPQDSNTMTTNSEDKRSENNFNSLRSIVKSIRNIRAQYKMEVSRKTGAKIWIDSKSLLEDLVGEKEVLYLLAKLEPSSVEITSNPSIGKQNDSNSNMNSIQGNGDMIEVIVEEGVIVYLPLKDMIDRDKEKARISKQIEKLEKEIKIFQDRLQSEGFRKKAPAKLVEDMEKNLKESSIQLEKLKESLISLNE